MRKWSKLSLDPQNTVDALVHEDHDQCRGLYKDPLRRSNWKIHAVYSIDVLLGACMKPKSMLLNFSLKCLMVWIPQQYSWLQLE